MDKSKQDLRDELSQQFAELIHDYQQDHHRLMDYLHDDKISIEEFNRLSDRLRSHVQRLKEVKVELLRRRRDIGEGP